MFSIFSTPVPLLSVCLFVLCVYVLYLRSNIAKRVSKKVEHVTRGLAADRYSLYKLYNQSPVPYLTLLPDGTIHNPNMATVRFFGMRLEELEGREFFKMFLEEDGDKISILQSCFKSGVPIDREEIKIVCKDGASRWVMLSVFLFRSQGQRQQNGMVTLVDINDQKELDQAKTEFVSLAGHQLRTPLSAVKWYTELLLTDKYGELNEKQKEYIGKVRTGNQNMIDLVDMLLNVSRIETGKLPVDVQEMDILELIDGVLEEVGPQIEQKGHIIKKQYGDIQSIDSDPKLLRIVVQNLFTNAVKYTPEGGTVTVSLRNIDGRHELLVSDTGYGIPADQQDKIFGKMFRAYNMRKKAIDGNGLGLYLVKSIVEKLGGTIGFTSVENEGTTFTVSLP